MGLWEPLVEQLGGQRVDRWVGQLVVQLVEPLVGPRVERDGEQLVVRRVARLLGLYVQSARLVGPLGG